MAPFLLLFYLFATITSKVYEQTFTYSAFKRENGWVYLSKMVLSPGTSSIQYQTIVKGSLNEPIDLEFAIIHQHQFPTESQYKCENSNYLPTVSLIHTLTPNSIPSTTSTTLTVQSEQLYYFLLRDCKKLITANSSLNTILVSSKLVIMNNNIHPGSQQDIWYIYPSVFIICLVLLWRINKQGPLEGDKNWLQFMLMMGIMSRLFSIFWKSIGFSIYWNSGSNYTIFQILYLALQGLSECIIISIIILIGFGWYLLFVNHSDFDIFITLLALLSTLNIVLNVLNVINDDSYDKYHMYDTIPSIIQTAFRIIALFCFVGGIKLVWKKLNPNQRKFMLKFGIFGVVYILWLPLTLIIASRMETLRQNQFVLVFTECFQMGSAVLLTYLTTFKSSSYNKVSINNNTFLPVQQNQKYF